MNVNHPATRQTMIGRRNLLGATVAATVAAPLSALAPSLARAEAVPASGPQGGGFYRFSLGDFSVSVISDGAGPLPGWPALAANATEAEFTEVLARNFIDSPVGQATNNLTLIDTGTDLVLIDTGAGVTFGPTFGQLAANLARAGHAPEDVTLVILTHGHSDHIAGLLRPDGTLAFPNARYAMAAAEFDYWTGDRFEAEINGSPLPAEFKSMLIGAAQVALPPIAERTTMLGPDAEVVPGITLVPAPGHTVAHSVVHVASGGAELLHLADVAHNPVTSLQRPDWTPIFDRDPAQAVATRRALLDRAATDRVLVLGYHFPFPALGHVEAYDGAWRWSPAPWIW